VSVVCGSISEFAVSSYISLPFTNNLFASSRGVKYAVSMSLQGAPIKNNPLGKMHNFCNCNRFCH